MSQDFCSAQLSKVGLPSHTTSPYLWYWIVVAKGFHYLAITFIVWIVYSRLQNVIKVLLDCTETLCLHSEACHKCCTIEQDL